MSNRLRKVWQLSRRLGVTVAALAMLLALAAQAEISLLGGGYVPLPNGTLFDWGSYVPAQVARLIEGGPTAQPCYLTVYDAQSHQTLHIDRCDQMDGR